MNNKYKTKSNKLIQEIVAISTSACMILTSFGITNIQAKDTVSPVTDLCFRETKRYVKKLSFTFRKISCF